MGKTVMLRGACAAVIAVVLLASVPDVVAQSVVDPRLAEFDPSPQHHELASDGTAIVQKYVLAFYRIGEPTPFQTLNLGKPHPGSDGKIRVDFMSLLSDPPAGGALYEARVSAVGPGGTAASETSNTFAFSSTCAPHLNASVITVPSSGGSGTVGLSAETGCSWTVTSSATWLTITSAASGTGTGTISFDVAANSSAASRSAVITAAGASFTVTQTGVACAYELSLSSASVTAGGGNVALTIATDAACAWSATTDTSWITPSSGSAGYGSKTITLNVATNFDSTSRTGVVTVGSRTLTLTQDASPCAYTFASNGQSMVATGGTGSVGFSATSGCSWTATSSAPWLTITSSTSGTGGATVAYTVAANAATTPRTGTITAAGKTFSVTQAAEACTYALSPASGSVSAGGGSGSATLTASSSCDWTATSSAAWLTITSGQSGSGPGTIAYTAAPNATGAGRTATITAAGQTLTIAQAHAACTHALVPVAQSIPAAGGTGSTLMTGTIECSWTATSNASWITIAGSPTGVGGDTISFSVSANSNGPRTGTITAAGQTFTISQAGAPCSYTLARTSQVVIAEGGENSIDLSTGSSCEWIGISDSDWITFTNGASGSGPGTIGYRVEPNPTSSWRTGSLTVGGARLSISQYGSPCTVALDSTSASVSAAGGTGAVAVTTLATCYSRASSDATWLTITSVAGGYGPRIVTYSVAPNPDTTSRTGTLTIAGQAFTVTQGAGAGCTYTVAPTSQIVSAPGGAGQVNITTGVGCEWVSISSASWLAVASGASGSGTGTIGYIVEPNTAGTWRSGILTIGGQRFTVSQAGVGCTFTLDQTSASAPAAGGVVTVTLGTPTGCVWSASSKASWLTITSGTYGNGPRTFSITVAPNGTNSFRIGTLVIAGQTFTVTQAGQ